MKHHLLALFVVAVWGVTFISTKVLIGEGLLPAQIFAIRFLIAYGGIWLLCAKSKKTRRLFSDNFKDELMFVLLGISGGSLYFYTENSALVYTQASNVSFIVSTVPLLTALLTLLARKFNLGGLEDISGKKNLAIGSLIALAGVAAISFDGSAVKLSAKGDLLALSAAILWALYSILMNRMTIRYGTTMATRKVFFYGLVTIIPFIVGSGIDLSIFSRPAVWGNLLFLSVIGSLVCFVLWNKVMCKLGNVTATNYIYLNPLFTLIAAVLLLGETLSLQSGLGCAAILAGVVIGGSKFGK